MTKTVDRDKFLNELNERIMGLTIAQSIIISVLADLSGDFTENIEKRIKQTIKEIPEHMQTPAVMNQIDYIIMSLGKKTQSKKRHNLSSYLKVINGGKSQL